MKEQLRQFAQSNRNYRGYDLHLNIIDKVFAHGCGCLNLFRFYPDKKVIVINRTVYTKADGKKLSEFCRDNHIRHWQWKFATLAYPNWYASKLSISMCN